ncbi:MAG TPA: tetratricopeptide repeat protein [Bacillota bacterium]|jgi:tetratricopeptide (TPR) repeat protein|nr:tetratricopeptide repeat protein [Bacillota bacterium]HOL10785.1 tetratricopeptide repeat protein [Bacillota bacterium]HPO98241.1 tetratricopeptide repeat protein [Bacillota bacterium]
MERYWDRLGIEPVSDIRAIKKAYALKLKEFHPEDNPQGFQELREAYESIVKMIEKGVAPFAITQSEANDESGADYEADGDNLEECHYENTAEVVLINEFRKKVIELYHDVAKRIDIANWEELLDGDLKPSVTDQDTRDYFDIDIREQINKEMLRFLVHYNVFPDNIWAYFRSQLYMLHQSVYMEDFLLKSGITDTEIANIDIMTRIGNGFGYEIKQDHLNDYDAFWEIRHQAYLMIINHEPELAREQLDAAYQMIPDDKDLKDLIAIYLLINYSFDEAFAIYQNYYQADRKLLQYYEKYVSEYRYLTKYLDSNIFMNANLFYVMRQFIKDGTSLDSVIGKKILEAMNDKISYSKKVILDCAVKYAKNLEGDDFEAAFDTYEWIINNYDDQIDDKKVLLITLEAYKGKMRCVRKSSLDQSYKLCEEFLDTFKNIIDEEVVFHIADVALNETRDLVNRLRGFDNHIDYLVSILSDGEHDEGRVVLERKAKEVIYQRINYISNEVINRYHEYDDYKIRNCIIIAYRNLIAVCEDQNDNDTVVNYYDKIMALSEWEAMSEHNWWSRALALNRSGRFEEALASCQKALEYEEDVEASNWNIMGWAYKGLKRYNEAMECYDKALSVDSNDDWAWSNKSSICFERKQYELGIEYADNQIKTHPENSLAWNNKAVCLEKLKRYQEALACIEKALELDENELFLSNKGNILRELGEYDQAMECYNKALELDAQFDNALNGKGCLKYCLDFYDEALWYFEQALIIEPENDEYWANKSDALFKLERYKEAAESFRRAWELKATD